MSTDDAPTRLRRATVLAEKVAGRLQAVFRYRHPLFSDDAAHRFADVYVEAPERFLAL